MTSAIAKRNQTNQRDGVVVIDSNKKIISINDHAGRILGYQREDIIGKHFDCVFQGLPVDDIDMLFPANRRDPSLCVPMKCIRADGTILYVIASVSHIYSSETQPGTTVTIHQSLHMADLFRTLDEAQKTLLERQQELQQYFDFDTAAVITLDNAGIISSFNRKAEEITGQRRSSVIGKPFLSVMGPVYSRYFQNHQEREASSFPGLRRDEGTDDTDEDLNLHVSSTQLNDNNGKKIGSILIISKGAEEPAVDHMSAKYDKIFGSSRSMRKIYGMIDRIVLTGSTVLITGESGTGKELVARVIHANSRHANGRFVPINCSAFTETLLASELFGHEKGAFTGAVHRKTGWLEMAKNGTIFLDEIGDIPPAVQVTLLRVLDQKRFERVGGGESINLNARIITATNKDLRKEIAAGRFRDDLFYRINVFNIHIPPLRQRMDDLYPLMNNFLRQFNMQFHKNINHISTDALNTLKSYYWPGNVRELMNVMEHAFILCDEETIEVQHLPEWLIEGEESTDKPDSVLSPSRHSIKDMEKKAIQSALKQYKGHRARTAESLGIDKVTLWRKMKTYGMLDARLSETFPPG